MLEVSRATVRFGHVTAVDEVDLSVERGEVVCVLGPSGCGKSTLLRAVAGLEPLVSGRIVLDGEDLAGQRPDQRGIGLMFQDDALFPHRDVHDNVAFGLKMRKVAKDRIDERVATTLAMVGLEGHGDRGVTQLSGGEQQRVALARAVAPEPRLLMLDEPLGSLDRALRDRLLEDLPRLFDRLGLTVLYVTHDQDEALALADRVVVMREGRIVQVAPPDELWRRPANEFVARFLGQHNIVDATVRDGVATTSVGRVPVDAADGQVRLLLLPDALALSDDGVAGTVSTRRFAGDHVIVRVAVDGTGTELDVAMLGGGAPHPGDEVHLSVDAEATVVLGPPDGNGQPGGTVPSP